MTSDKFLRSSDCPTLRATRCLKFGLPCFVVCPFGSEGSSSEDDTQPFEAEDRLADRFAFFCVVSLVWRLWVGIRLQPSHRIPFDLPETLVGSYLEAKCL